MILNYLKISLRNLLKNKYYSLINILGLALGITCVFLITQYLSRELAYDKFHEGSENIYRVIWDSDNPQTRTPHPLAQAMVHDFPEVENAVSLSPLWGPGLTRETFSIRNAEKNVQYDETGVLAVDTTFFKVFSFPIVKGDPDKALKEIGGLLISETAAHKYFGDEDPIGKFLTVNDDKTLIEVVAVFKDVPELSHFHFDFLVSYVREKALEDPRSEYYTWADFGHYNYVRLNPGADAKKLESQLTPWLKNYVDWPDETFKYFEDNHYGLKLQPITDIHLKSNVRWELEGNGNIDYVYMMIAAAILILVIACINFINLTTAQSAERAKEIGIRKSLGALKRQLIFQFTGESVLIACAAMLVSLAMTQTLVPVFNLMTESAVRLSVISLVGILGAIGIVVGLVAGIYPSLYLSSVNPTAALKGKFLRSPKRTSIRKGYTVFQFSASMVLICAAVVIFNQLQAIQNRPVGFNKEEVIVIPVKNQDALRDRFADVEEEFRQLAGVKEVSAASNIPGRSFNQNEIFESSHPENSIDVSELVVDHDFLNVLSIPLAEGRDFLRENPADADNAFLINETAARNLQLDHPVGKQITWERDGDDIRATVIGVVKDFNFQSLHHTVKPLLIKLGNNGFNYIVIKLNTNDFNKTIGEIEGIWKKFDNRFTFEFFFLEDALNHQYRNEQNINRVIIAFSGVAILIACFGLLGIAALTFRNKTKEISVRKVLGAELGNLVVLLLKDFTILILVAVIIATPVVIWIMQNWLQNFAYRVTLNPIIFIGAGMFLILLSWITLGYLTLTIARINPATTLKSE
ncbi:MAG TPA: ABC transporter permease [Cyclobacteriaceae bacterium]|jgi:putative ABC transport system permease protein